MTTNPEQEKLQKEFNDKQLELDALKSKISLKEKLSEVELKKKEELEKYIAENSTKLQVQNTQIDVKNTVGEAIDSRRVLEKVIKGSGMEAQLKALNKTDAQIEQFALRIDAVVRKYYAKELEGFPSAVIDGMVAGTQPAMIEALTGSGAASSELFTAAADGLSDNGIAAIFNKITGAVGNIQNMASGLLGPLSGEGPLPTLAKRVQNLTAFVVLHKVDMIDGSVPQLVNPYKYKKLLENPVRDTTKDFDKPETLALFTLHSTEGGQLNDNEKSELKKIVNNPALKIDEKTLSSMEKALETTDKFLDKRSFFQNAFMGIFEKIKGPLSLFMGKGKTFLPSSILGTGLLGTALGVAGLDAYYLSKNIVPAEKIITAATTTSSLALMDENDSELQKLATDVDAQKNTNFAENQTFVSYLSTLEVKNGLPQGIMLNLMKTESGGKMYRADGNILTSSAQAKGLFQFIPDTAKAYIVKLGYSADQYELMYTNPIISAKACALFLTERKEKGDDAVNILAHYNAGPGVMSGQKVSADTFAELPNETKNYVVKIGSAMLASLGLSNVLSESDKTNVGSIPKNTLNQFLTAVNSVPVQNVQAEQLATTTKIEAKTMNDVVLVGDSHAGGIKGMGNFAGKTFYYDGYDAGQLLGKIKDEKSSIKNYKSLVLVVGANDISKGIVGKIKDNLEKIKTEIQPVQLVLSTLPHSNVVADYKVDEVNDIITKFARENALPIVDLKKDVVLKDSEYRSDGHYTAEGYTKVAQDITSHITGSENMA